MPDMLGFVRLERIRNIHKKFIWLDFWFSLLEKHVEKEEGALSYLFEKKKMCTRLPFSVYIGFIEKDVPKKSCRLKKIEFSWIQFLAFSSLSMWLVDEVCYYVHIIQNKAQLNTYIHKNCLRLKLFHRETLKK